MSPVRVLQVLPDTDASEGNLAAIELHGDLAAAGVEVRTLALGPGRVGQLAGSVPVIAPSKRSLAAHTQLRAEQRWADVVLLRGAEVAAVSALAGGSITRIMVLWNEPQRWADGARAPLGARRGASRCASVVVGWNGAVSVAAERLALATDRIVVLPSYAPAGEGSRSTSLAARTAARAAVGVREDQLAVLVLDGPLDAAALRAELGDEAVVVDPTRDDALDPEVVRAAVDVVVVSDGSGGAPPELLRAMLAGAVAIVPAHPALADLVQDGVSGRVVQVPVAAASVAAAVRALDPPSDRQALADAGGDAVRDAHRAADVVPRWLDLVQAALPSRP